MKRENLQDLRNNIGLTQKQAANELSITKEYLSMIENAVRNPSDTLKEKMSKLYNRSIADIFLAINSTKCLKNKNAV